MKAKKLKTLALALFLSSGLQIFSQEKENFDIKKRIVGLGINTNKELAISNSFYKRLKFGAGLTYRHSEGVYGESLSSFYMNLDVGIRWKKNSRYCLSSSVLIPIEFRYEIFDNFGAPSNDLELNLYLENIPLELEVIPFKQFKILSIFGGARFRYFYLDKPKFYGGAKINI